MGEAAGAQNALAPALELEVEIKVDRHGALVLVQHGRAPIQEWEGLDDDGQARRILVLGSLTVLCNRLLDDALQHGGALRFGQLTLPLVGREGREHINCHKRIGTREPV